MRRLPWAFLSICCALACREEPRERPILVEDNPPSIARAPEPRVDGAAERSPGDGSSSDVPRIYVVGASVDIFEAPRSSSAVMGSARAGGSLRAQLGVSNVADPACRDGWSAVDPRGFVCEAELTTRDATDAVARTRNEYRLTTGAALPASYGVSEDTPVYAKLPARWEQVRAEQDLPFRKRRASSDGGVDDEGARRGTEIPDVFRVGSLAPKGTRPLALGSSVAAALPAGSRVAWVGEFDDGDRSWLVTPDCLLLPRDRVSPAIVSGFHGTQLNDAEGVAFIGNKPERKYKKDAGGRFVAASDVWPAESAVLLQEPANRFTEERFLPALEAGIYLRVEHAIVAHPTPPTRWGLEPGARWIEVNLRNNLLLLREGGAVSFATLVSVGRGSPAKGRYRIFSKHVTLALPFERPRTGKAETPDVLMAMDAPDSREAFPLYGAWWFYAWGTSNAEEGVALAPIDARRIFDWATPDLPDGWHSVKGEGTWLIVHD